MSTANLLDIATQTYDIGRAAIFRADYWNGGSDLLAQLTHLGNTEGEVNPTGNEEFSMLTIPENLGPAALKVYVTGAFPGFETGMFVNPTLLPILSPTGSGSIGNTRQRRVKEHTLWIVPEQLFIKPDSNGIEQEVTLDLTAGVWTKDGEPFTAEDTRLFGLSSFVWRAYFERAMPVYRHEDGGKSLQQVSVKMLQDLDKPNGHQILTVGADLATSGIDLEGASS